MSPLDLAVIPDPYLSLSEDERRIVGGERMMSTEAAIRRVYAMYAAGETACEAYRVAQAEVGAAWHGLSASEKNRLLHVAAELRRGGPVPGLPWVGCEP